MTNMDKLYEAVEARGPVCVGLDTDFSYLPADFVDSTLTKGENIVRFNKKLIDATKAVAGCYKVQIAYYESLGMEGMKAYADTLKAVREAGVPVIADIKRGDIAKTAEMYAKAHFTGDFEADIITLAPYMGLDSISPYLPYCAEQGKGVFVLCRTSNPGGRDIEERKTADGRTVFEIVAEKAQKEWNKNGELGLVAGATQPSELARIRSLAPTLPLLIPGIGAQGGDVNAAVAAGLDAAGFGIAVNSSRAILYAGKDEMFAQASAAAAKATRDAINAAKAKALAARG